MFRRLGLLGGASQVGGNDVRRVRLGYQANSAVSCRPLQLQLMIHPQWRAVYLCIAAQEQTSAHAAGTAPTSIVVSLSVPWRFRGSALCGLSQAVSARRPPMRRRNLARIAMAPPATPVTSPQLLRLVRRFTNRFRGNAAHAADRVKSAATGARRQPFPCAQPTGPKLGQPRTQADGEVVTESNLRRRAAARGTTRMRHQ